MQTVYETPVCITKCDLCPQKVVTPIEVRALGGWTMTKELPDGWITGKALPTGASQPTVDLCPACAGKDLNHRGEVTWDTDADNPLTEWDIVGRCISSTRGRECYLPPSKGLDMCGDAAQEWLDENHGNLFYIVHVRVYKHSGVRVFRAGDDRAAYIANDLWDTGTAGLWVFTREEAQSLMRPPTPDAAVPQGTDPQLVEACNKYVDAMLEVTTAGYNGEVYVAAAVDALGETIDCCGGLYGLEDVLAHLRDEWGIPEERVKFLDR